MNAGCPLARALLALVVAALAAVACQPVEEPLPEADEQPTPAGEDPERVGAPDEDVPGDVETLLSRTDPEAARWQPEPRPSEATVDLDADGAWQEASVTYVAGDADSALVVRVDDGGVSTERVTFETLGLEPIAREAVEDVPPLEGLTAPEALAEAAEERFADCDASGPPARVRLATGAPATWEGEGWAQPPEWAAIVFDGDGNGVRLDAESATPDDDPCVEATEPEFDDVDPDDLDPEDIEPEA